MSIYRRILQYYRPFWPQTAVGLLLSLIGIGLNLLKPWPFKIIVDEILPNPKLALVNHPTFGSVSGLVLILCGALIAIQLLWGIANWITNYLFVKIGLQALLKPTGSGSFVGKCR